MSFISFIFRYEHYMITYQYRCVVIGRGKISNFIPFTDNNPSHTLVVQLYVSRQGSGLAVGPGYTSMYDKIAEVTLISCTFVLWYLISQPFKHNAIHDTNFVVTGCTGSCNYDKLRCRQWRQSWHHDKSQFSICSSTPSSYVDPISCHI